MGDNLKEECGICGIYLKNPIKNSELISYNLDLMLNRMQRRGQTGSGISIFKIREGKYGKVLKTLKKPGLVSNLFGGENLDLRKKIIKENNGIAGIGHVRYGTSGNRGNTLDLLQPFLRRHGKKWKKFSICFNGNLANYPELEEELRKRDYDLETDVDTEVIMHLFSLGIKKFSDENNEVKPDFFDLSNFVMQQIDGAFNILLLFGDGNLIAIRDSYGFKPLVWGENQDFYAIASESVALERIGIRDIQVVPPGSVIIFNANGVFLKQLFFNQKKAFCQFEAIYFSDSGSLFEGKSIYEIRRNLGKELAKAEPLKEFIKKNKKNYVVVPVPETSNAAAEGFAEILGLSFRPLGLRKLDKTRGFINEYEKREDIMNRIYDVIKEIFQDKEVFLIEDSIIRGETLGKTINLIKNTNPKAIHVRVTEPKVCHPCFYGVDMSTYGEFIANVCDSLNLEEEIAKKIGADTFFYQKFEGLINSLGFDKNEICHACLTGDYPTEFGKKRAEEALKKFKDQKI
ncbi:amidophosphoribosyltransferase [Candidatus Pacearchaeota archaeon]|nr:hypothetical protein [uncultured archaeon]AQS32544.1 hypothetical protein [uncultured archaeon]AQS33086.1 hypothetical protein [uncultured archaeon]MBS3074930.1 amidophosphoribosyltransferase [Candidatus Pacearchaeota archaeon]